MKNKAANISWSLDKAVDQFLAESFAEGDLVSHDWIRWCLDINEQSLSENPFVLLDRVESLKEALLIDHSIALANVRGEGYRIVPPGEQALYAARTAAHFIEKGLKKADSLLTHTRMDMLNQSERRRHNDASVRVAGLGGMMKKGKRDIIALFDVSKKKT